MRRTINQKIFILAILWATVAYGQTYKIVDTEQNKIFNNSLEISAPQEGEAFYGQDAQYEGNQPSYINNDDGTITDEVTGLMWQKSFVTLSWSEAEAQAAAVTTGGYTDWRVPTIKELYSLILFSGNQGSGNPSSSTPPGDAVPFVDTDYFDFEYPTGSRYIDAQYVSSTEYTSTTMNGNATFFGLNLADGRIKGYPQVRPNNTPYYARFVRGGNNYGQNDFTDNNNNTVTDAATGLMWNKFDSGDDVFASLLSNYTNDDGSLNWEEALHFAENMTFAGFEDWRLPNVKELHSILDYTRSPDATNSPAINSIFATTEIINEGGANDYPGFWSSTTFNPGSDAALIYFGRALGYMDFGSGAQFYDVHGAGAQRTDAKIGEPTYGFGPQGDVRRVYNYVRLVRNTDVTTGLEIGQSEAPGKFQLHQNYPNPFNPETSIAFALSEAGSVKLAIFNLLGQQIDLLVDEPLSAGEHRYSWSASGQPSGAYFYKLSTGSVTETRKMVFLQ